MVDVLTAFVLIGSILFLGYGALKFFQRTNIPDILVLIAVGVVLGPVLRVVDAAPIDPLLNFFASVALMVIMLSAGLHFNFLNLVKNLPKSTLFAFLAYAVTVALVFLAAYFGFAWPLLPALFLAFIISDTDPAIVYALLPNLRTDEETKVSIGVESVVSSTVSAVLGVTILYYAASSTLSMQGALGALASAFSVAIVAGAVAGFAWFSILKRIADVSFASLLTLGAAFVLYGASSLLQANGAISVFIFGLVLGNAKTFSAALSRGEGVEPAKEITMFQDQIAFFVRTFFFVYVGLVLHTALAPGAYLLGIAASVAIVASREISVRFFGEPRHPSALLNKYVIPTGLSSLVLALLPPAGFAPGMMEAVLIVIVLTNAVTAVAVFWHQRSYQGPVEGRPRVLTRPLKR